MTDRLPATHQLGKSFVWITSIEQSYCRAELGRTTSLTINVQAGHGVSSKNA
jgi:hypothetical protein